MKPRPEIIEKLINTNYKMKQQTMAHKTLDNNLRFQQMIKARDESRFAGIVFGLLFIFTLPLILIDIGFIIISLLLLYLSLAFLIVFRFRRFEIKLEEGI